MNTNQSLPGSFEELIKTHDKPILVDFWAEWCGPCRMVSPEVEKLAREWKGQVTVIKINTDEKQIIALKYGITSIPTLILFKNGREAKRISGAMSSEQMKKVFSEFL